MWERWEIEVVGDGGGGTEWGGRMKAWKERTRAGARVGAWERREHHLL